MVGIFGSTQGTKKMAKPLAYAPLPVRGLGRALGASNLPGTCWDVAGFKDCHAKAYAQAKSECAGGLARDNYGGDMNTCIERNADAYAWAGCVGQYCPPSTTPKAPGATSISWRNSSYNATVDGILGSGTCGAAYWVDGAEGTTFYDDYGLAKICKVTSMPTKAGTKDPITVVSVMPQTTVTKDEAFQERSDLPWGTFDADTVEVQKRLNVMLDASDMNAINTGGKLDAPTCGAMRWGKTTQGIDLLSIQGQNCQGFTDPTKKIRVATPVVIPSSSSVDPTLPTTTPRTSAASMATTGLILAALGVGGYFVGKKYNWF